MKKSIKVIFSSMLVLAMLLSQVFVVGATNEAIISSATAHQEGIAGERPILFFMDSQHSGLVTSHTLPGVTGHFYSHRATNAATTITLMSPHAGLRFRIYDADAFRINPSNPSALLFDSNTPPSGIRQPNRGMFSIPIRPAQNMHVQKINGNQLNSQTWWQSGKDYFIVVYTPTNLLASNPDMIYHLAVGQPMRSEPHSTGDVMWNGNLSIIGSTVRSNFSLNFRNFWGVRETSVVHYIDFWGAQVPYLNWSMTASGPSTARLTGTSANWNTLRSHVFPTNSRPSLYTTWHIDFSANLPANRPPGDLRPALNFWHTFEIGD